jgi:hypothetical protein
MKAHAVMVTDAMLEMTRGSLRGGLIYLCGVGRYLRVR